MFPAWFSRQDWWLQLMILGQWILQVVQVLTMVMIEWVLERKWHNWIARVQAHICQARTKGKADCLFSKGGDKCHVRTTTTTLEGHFPKANYRINLIKLPSYNLFRTFFSKWFYTYFQKISSYLIYFNFFHFSCFKSPIFGYLRDGSG